MKKVICFVLFAIGIISFSFSQQELSDSLEYRLNNFEKTLLIENDSLRLVYDQTKSKLTKDQINAIFSKIKTKEYSIKKAELALQLTAYSGENWHFNDSLKDENVFHFDSFEEFVVFHGSIPTTFSSTVDKDDNIKKVEHVYNNGSTVVIQKNEFGQYIKTTTDENGIESSEILDDISNYLRMRTEIKKIKD